MPHLEETQLKSVDDYKSTMSVKGDKVGLRRKLTGPPRLLLGKSKARSDTESKEKIWDWRQKRSRDSNGTQEDLSAMPGCQAIREEVPQKYATGGIQLPLGLKQDELTLESSIGTTMSPSIEQSDGEANPSDQKHNRQAPGDSRKGWKRLFFPSLTCVGRLRRRTCEKVNLDEGESNNITFFNRQTRDSVDLTAQASAVYSGMTSEEHEHDSSNHDPPTMELKETFRVRSWRFFKRLMIAPKKKRKTKHKQSGPGTSLQDDTPCVLFSFKKRSEQLWRRRTTKPSPFFQERIGDTQEYIEEETIVLANRHVDGVPEAAIHSVHPHVGREVKGHSPETLTVSADVSAMNSEIREVQTSEETEAYETLASTTEKVDVREETQRSLEDALMEADEMPLHPYPLETLGGPQRDGLNLSKEEVGVQKQQHLRVECESVASSTPLSSGEDISLNVVDKNDDSNTDISEATFSHISNIDVMKENIPTSVTANSDDGDMSKDVQSSPVDLSDSMKNGSSDTFRHGVLSAEDNGGQEGSDRDCELQQKEMLLLETARSVVRAVVRASLNQLREELVDSVATLNQEAGEH